MPCGKIMQSGIDTIDTLPFLVEDDTLAFLVEDEAFRPVQKYCPVVSPHRLSCSVLTFHKAFCVIMFILPLMTFVGKRIFVKFVDSPM